MRDLDQLPGPIVVCVPADTPAAFDDDVLGTCALCGAGVRCRPHVPAGSLLCLLCFVVNADEDAVCVTTAESLAELVSLAADVPKC